MIGYAELLNARLTGFAPLTVWVHVLDCEPSYYLKRDAQEAIENGFRVSLLILPNESIASLDLTTLTDLTVNVIGQNVPRVHAIIRHCLRYAKQVINESDAGLTILRGVHEAHA